MPLRFLQEWYMKQCNGFWEHAHGVTIETLDIPGWLVRIDLMETPLENEAMEPVKREISAQDWIVCEVSHRQFQGQGDARKLGDILHVFENWASSRRSG
jgi:hypothetical protein